MLYNLAWLLQNTDSHYFLNKLFEKKSVLVRKSAENYFDSLLSEKELDNLLCATLLNKQSIRIAKNGKIIPEDNYTDLVKGERFVSNEKILDHLADKHTIIVEGIHRYIHQINVLCKQLQEDFQSSVFINCYVTPASSSGFDIHYDPHCVFIVQIMGSKKWLIAERPSVTLPIEGVLTPEHNPGKTETLTLEKGDVLYLPRGMKHKAETQEEFSVHLTIGIYPVMANEIYKSILDEFTKKHKEMRKGIISKEYDFQELKALADFLNKSKKNKKLVPTLLQNKILNENSWAIQKNRLSGIIKADILLKNTIVQITTGLIYHLQKEKEGVILYFNNKEIRIDGIEVNDILILKEPKEIQALFSQLSVVQKIRLAKLLLKNGFLEYLG